MSTRPFPPPPAPVEGEKTPTYTKHTTTIKTPHSETEYTVSYIDEKKFKHTKGTVVLLHGLLTTSASYGKLIPLLLDEGYRVIAPDLPGCGGSTEEKLWADMDDKAGQKPHEVIETLGDVEIRGGWDEAGHWLHALLHSLNVWSARFWTGDLGAPFILGMYYLKIEFAKQQDEAVKKSEAGDKEALQKYNQNRQNPIRIEAISTSPPLPLPNASLPERPLPRHTPA
jgi:pimeloyl-ACP methyl ester carboxylesterase